MRGEQHDWPKLMVRLPPDAKAWVAQQSQKFGSSQNAEIVRAIRERMERTNEMALESAVTLAKA